MIVVAFSKYRCVILHQIEFIHTNFFISVLARTDDIVLTLSNAVSNCSKDKIKEIKAEYENLKPIFEKLENLSSEKKTLPMNLEEDALTASEEKSMIQSGYLTRDRKAPYGAFQNQQIHFSAVLAISSSTSSAISLFSALTEI